MPERENPSVPRLSGHGLNPSEPGRPTERRDPIVDGDELRRHAIPVRDGDGPPDGPGGRPPGGRGRRQDPLDEVAEAILDNESLRSDLEGDAAEELLDWTIRTAQGLVERHVELAADPVVAARTELRALRRTVRSINRLAGMDRRPTRREASRRRDLLLEIAALREQLEIYRRQVKRPKLRRGEAASGYHGDPGLWAREGSAA